MIINAGDGAADDYVQMAWFAPRNHELLILRLGGGTSSIGSKNIIFEEDLYSK